MGRFCIQREGICLCSLLLRKEMGGDGVRSGYVNRI